MQTADLMFVPTTNIGSGYEFQAVVPHGSGLQVASQTCEWSRTAATDSGWVLPFSAITVLSCSLGTGETKIELRMRKEERSGDGIKVGETGDIQPPWHRKHHTVTYLIDTGSFAGATVDISAKIGEVAKVWTDASLGIAFKAYDSSTDAKVPGRNIKIKGYVHGDAEGCSNRSAIACVKIEGTYPHLTNDQKYYVRKDLNWTIKWEEYKNNPDRPRTLLYLPHTLAHEFGHTLGLGHSGTVNDVMSPGTTYNDDRLKRNFDDGCTSKCDLSDNDENAVRHLYPSTHSH